MLSQPERVLIVDDDELALEAMAESIGVLGLQVSTADNGETAWEMFEREDHDLVVTDVRMPQHDGLSLTAQVKAYRPSCPVILVTGYGGEKTAIAALRAGASDFLVKPFQLSELHASVERACSLVRAQRAEERIIPLVEQNECTMILDNVPELVGGVINVLLRPLNGCILESERMRLRIVLQELVLNAMEHGNLHVSSEEKNQALLNDQYEELLAERRASPHFRSLRVRLTMNHDVLAGSIRFQICDEGEGFDWQRILGREPQDLPMTAGAGRGIFLVRALIQDVAYIGKGNEVVFTIRYDPLSH